MSEPNSAAEKGFSFSLIEFSKVETYQIVQVLPEGSETPPICLEGSLEPCIPKVIIPEKPVVKITNRTKRNR